MTVENFLWMCSWCKRIKDEDGHIFSREENSQKYDSLVQEYKGRITHGICHEDSEKFKKDK